MLSDPSPGLQKAPPSGGTLLGKGIVRHFIITFLIRSKFMSDIIGGVSRLCRHPGNIRAVPSAFWLNCPKAYLCLMLLSWEESRVSETHGAVTLPPSLERGQGAVSGSC